MFSAFIASLAVSMALIPPLMAWSTRLHALDLPDARKVHTVPIARIGGIAIGLGPFVSVLCWAPKNQMVTAYAIGAAIVWVLGIWDDRSPLDFRIKFGVQLLAALIVVWYGDLRLDRLPFWTAPFPAWLSVALTVVALLGVTNAINLSDGLDGLAGGLCILTFGTLGYFGYLADEWAITLIAAAVSGGLLGFLRFNTYPARVFMGDGGSQFLGFSAGVLAIWLIQSDGAGSSPVLAPFVLGLPVIDTLGVIAQRLLERRSPFLPDKNHIHHKLLTAGCFHHEAVLVIYAVQASLVTLAVLLSKSSEARQLGVYIGIALPTLAFFLLAGRLRWQRPDRDQSRSIAMLRSLRASRWVTEAPIRILGVGIPAFLALSVFFPKSVPTDFGVLAAALFGFVLLGLALVRWAAPFLIRVGLYVGGTFVLYLSDQAPVVAGAVMHATLNVFFGVMAVLVLVVIRFQSGTRFETTPLDYLLVFLAVMIPYLPEIGLGGAELGLLMTKLLILFFAYELLLHTLSRRLVHLGAVSLWVLLGLGIRAWW